MFYPFTHHAEGCFSISVQIWKEEVYQVYASIFDKYGQFPDGHCWEGLILHILENVDEELLNHIDFDSEADGFFAYADSKANQVRFLKVLSPFFQELQKLEETIKGFLLSWNQN